LTIFSFLFLLYEEHKDVLTSEIFAFSSGIAPSAVR